MISPQYKIFLVILASVFLLVSLTLFISFEKAIIFQFIYLISIAIFFYLTKKIDSFRLLIVVLMVNSFYFDSEPFLISEYNVRLWYFLLPIYFIYLIEDLRDLRFQKTSLLIIIWVLLVSVIELILNRAFLDALKYILFYILPICFIVNSLIRSRLDVITLMHSFLLMSVPILIFGVFQFFTGVYFGFMDNPLYPPIYNIEPRPVSFFSETTWLSELAVFSFIISFSLKTKTSFISTQLLCLFLVIVTVTRNSYLAIVASFLISMCCYLASGKVNKNFVNYIIVCSSAFVMCYFTVDSIAYLIDSLFSRFTDLDTGGGGRLEAFYIAFEMFLNSDSKYIGNGFEWSKDIVAGQGSSLGAKAFNSIIMFNHIFGVFFTVLLLYYFFKKMFDLYASCLALDSSIKALSIVSICIGLSFFSISMFAPIHQYPLGISVVSLFFVTAYKLKKERYVKPIV